MRSYGAFRAERKGSDGSRPCKNSRFAMFVAFPIGSGSGIRRICAVFEHGQSEIVRHGFCVFIC